HGTFKESNEVITICTNKSNEIGNIIMKNASKGKWIPGSLESLRKTHGCGYSFYCDTCERGFSNQSSLDKHNSTELHFKRLLKSKPECDSFTLTRGNQFGFDPLGDNEGLPSQRKRRNVQIKNYGNRKPGSGKGTEGKVRCPTCYAHFHEEMMGKHLLSFFHCQKSEIEGRRVDPEKSLILENIHSIVVLSPYQCKPCRFYFTHRLQLLWHFERYHVSCVDRKLSGKPEEGGWICSACRSKGYDAVGMMNHLKNSPEHAKMEAAIQNERMFEEVSPESAFKSVKNDTVEQSSGQSNENSVRLEDPASGSRIAGAELGHNTKSLGTIHFSSDSRFICTFCQFSTKSRAHFSRHLKIHDESRTKTFGCESCNATFYEKYQLNYHMKLHTGKSIQCNHPGCEYIGRSNSELQNKSHKEFKCNQCSYATNLPQGLKRHELTHTNSSMFFCPYCKYSSKSMDNIRIHVLKRKIHEGATLYTCRICKSESRNFTCNKFNVFKQHVVRNHTKDPHSSTDFGIFVLAGLRKTICPTPSFQPINSSDSEMEKVNATTVSQGNISRKLMQLETDNYLTQLKRVLTPRSAVPAREKTPAFFQLLERKYLKKTSIA
ncbi:unnamed protein product, partial [Allacma fusca]